MPNLSRGVKCVSVVSLRKEGNPGPGNPRPQVNPERGMPRPRIPLLTEEGWPDTFYRLAGVV